MSVIIKKYWTLIVILILAFLLRLPHLTDSFWLDEAAQALEADRPFSQQLNLVDDFQPPLLHLLTFFSIQISDAEWWLRLIGAVIPGLLTIWGTYALGRKLVSQKVGLLSALLLATSSFFIFFSQELRPYALSCVFVIWSWFFLLESQKVGRDAYQLKLTHPFNKFFALFPIPRDFFLFLLLTIGGLYSSYLYPFVLASQLIFLLVKKRWRNFWYAALIPTIAFLPWLGMFWQQLTAGQALRQSFPGWENIVSFSTLKAPVLTFGKFLYGVIDLQVNWLFVSATLVWLCLLLTTFFSHSRQFLRANKNKFALWIFFLLLPFLLATLVSFFIPVIQPKRVIFLLPFAYLLLSFIILGDFHEWKNLRPRNWLLLIFVLVANLFGTYQYYFNPLYQRENWRQALTALHQNYQSDQTIALFAYAAPFSPWSWYEKDHPTPFPTISTGNYDTSRLPNLYQTISPVKNYQYVIVFDYLRSLTDANNLIPKFLTDFGYEELIIYDYNSLGFIRVYQRLTPNPDLERSRR